MSEVKGETTEPQKIAAALSERGFKDGWTKTEWTGAVAKELERYHDEILKMRGCDKCDVCEDHHA